MTIDELLQRYSEGIEAHEKALLARMHGELRAGGLVDEDGVPSRAGEYIIPLLLFVHTTNRSLIHEASASFMDDEEESSAGSPTDQEDVFKDFGNLLTQVTKKVEEAGHEDARDMVMGTVIPEMNSFFALSFVWLLTQLRFIDIVEKDPSLSVAFESDGLNGASFKAIAMYRSMAAEKGDKWAVMIADKAKMFWSR